MKIYYKRSKPFCVWYTTQKIRPFFRVPTRPRMFSLQPILCRVYLVHSVVLNGRKTVTESMLHVHTTHIGIVVHLPLPSVQRLVVFAPHMAILYHNLFLVCGRYVFYEAVPFEKVVYHNLHLRIQSRIINVIQGDNIHISTYR